MIMNPIEINDDHQNLPSGPSHLFLLRLWMQGQHEAEDLTNWLGRLQDPITGEALEFQGWTELRGAILCMMTHRDFLGG